MTKLIGTLVPMSAIGTFAPGLVFLDWLKKVHQSAWQLLPLYETQLEPGSPTKHVPSPYKSYGIGLDPKYLPMAFSGISPTEQEKQNFICLNSWWIHDYALFCAIRDHFKTDDWRNWDKDLRSRNKTALALWTNRLSEKIDNHIILQWQLHQSYTQLRNKAKKLGIVLIGDLPFYPSLQSPLVWAHQDVFQIQNGTMLYVSGIPNTPNAHFGRQIWGHPLYDWNHQEKVITFWQNRLLYHATIFDHIRFDHAKAFFEYGVMDIENQQNDRYVEGPGADVFSKLIAFSKQSGLSVFIEDSGEKTEKLRGIIKKLNISGIKIFRFALKKNENVIYKEYADISHYPKQCVAYTTTHDTETLLGYLNSLKPEQKQKLAASSGVAYYLDDKVFAQKLRDAILKSPADIVIIPIQDWLLTTDRINIPGTELPVNDPNWHFYLKIPIENLPTVSF